MTRLRWMFVLALSLLMPGLARAQTGAAPDPVRETKLLASDGAATDSFGVNISLAGDTALVGAAEDDDNGSDPASSNRTAGHCSAGCQCELGDGQLGLKLPVSVRRHSGGEYYWLKRTGYLRSTLSP